MSIFMRSSLRAVTPLVGRVARCSVVSVPRRRYNSMPSRPIRSQHVPSMRMASHMITRCTQSILEDIDLMVCDMAGTTVQEGGIVYKTLRESLLWHGFDVSEADIGPWHGAKKEAVIEHFAKQAGLNGLQLEEKVATVSSTFEERIVESYFSEDAPVRLIDDNLMNYFQKLRRLGMKIGLDTGYPQHIQKGLMQKLGLDITVDCYISSYDVREGRPYPYMIHTLMERLGVSDVRRVAKVGDSCLDVEMGRNAGCGLVVGVLSGADGAEDLFAAGADVVCDVITDLAPPASRASSQGIAHLQMALARPPFHKSLHA